mmetsp:Transcript_17860/g.23145  ORF Transcript_17860/g.23145 Transcript_17860/m.23145 type:complete len:453 (-) Transcript_17860:251-1609(-)
MITSTRVKLSLVLKKSAHLGILNFKDAAFVLNSRFFSNLNKTISKPPIKPSVNRIYGSGFDPITAKELSKRFGLLVGGLGASWYVYKSFLSEDNTPEKFHLIERSDTQKPPEKIREKRQLKRRVELRDSIWFGWFKSLKGTFLRTDQRKKLVNVLNLVIDLDGFNEAEEELIIDHAIRQMEKEMLKIIPNIMLRRIKTNKGFDEVPKHLYVNLKHALLKRLDLPYFDSKDKILAIRCFAVFCVECMEEDRCIDCVLEDIGLLVAEIFLKGACMMLSSDNRGLLAEEVAEELPIPFVPMFYKIKVIEWLMSVAALHLDNAFGLAFEEYQCFFEHALKDAEKANNITRRLTHSGESHHCYSHDHNSHDHSLDMPKDGTLHIGKTVRFTKLSTLVENKLRMKVMEVIDIPFIPKEMYTKYVDFGVNLLMTKLVDKQTMDAAGEAALKMKKNLINI